VGTKAALFPSFALLPSVAENPPTMAMKCEFTSPIKTLYYPTDAQIYNS